MDTKTCEGCKAKCCRYVTIEIKKPKKKEDIDVMRWYLLHKGVEVFIEDGVWHVQFNARCKKLGKDHRCLDYKNRPNVCREHSIEWCERYDKEKYVCFKNVEQFEGWAGNNLKF